MDRCRFDSDNLCGRVGWSIIGQDYFRYMFPEKSVAYSNSKLEFSRKGAASLVGWGYCMYVCIFFIFSIDNELITVEKKIDFSK